MLILRTLLYAPSHGHQIGQHIQQTTNEFLQMQHGSLYPALHRLEKRVGRLQTGGCAGPESGIQVLPTYGYGQKTTRGRRIAVEADGGSYCTHTVARG